MSFYSRSRFVIVPCITDLYFSVQFSGGTPLGALCGRGDLDPSKPRAYGCYDSKATTWSMALALEADAGAWEAGLVKPDKLQLKKMVLTLISRSLDWCLGSGGTYASQCCTFCLEYRWRASGGG